jgi:hypothetical protein
MLRALAVVFALALIAPAAAFDHGFDPYSPTVQWFETLKMPDYPPTSCCGKSDAYTADIYTRNPDGSYEVTVTDGAAITFPNGDRRTPLKNGTVIHVPAGKVNPPTDQAGNPTGHAWLFVSVYGAVDASGDQPVTTPGTVYCFIPLPEGS